MCRDLLESMLDYNRELNRLENKQQVLEQEARQRGLPIPQVLPSEKKKLHEKAKKMADKYSWIVFKHRSIGVSNQKDDKKMMSFMLFKSKILQNKETDKDFYENLFLFAARVLQGAFER